jgi:hypothetical protein
MERIGGLSAERQRDRKVFLRLLRRVRGNVAHTTKKTSRSGPPPARVGKPLAGSESASVTPLNFKVPPEFHRDFKTFAAQHSKKMVEVLQEAFALLKDKYGS